MWAKTITGITGDAVDYSWQVDTTPPVAVVLTGPTAALNGTSADLRTSSLDAFFTFGADDNAAGTCDGCTYLCQVDGTGWWPCDPNRGIGYGGFSKGVHKFEVGHCLLSPVSIVYLRLEVPV